MAIKLKDLLNELKNILTVYHGTNIKKLNDIKRNGLLSPKGYDDAGWYMVATDFESALFHATALKEGEKVIVFEFKVPVTNEYWDGNPYFWPPSKRSGRSKWYALQKPIPKNFIKKIHYVDYDDWGKQKLLGF